MAKAVSSDCLALDPGPNDCRPDDLLKQCVRGQWLFALKQYGCSRAALLGLIRFATRPAKLQFRMRLQLDPKQNENSLGRQDEIVFPRIWRLFSPCLEALYNRGMEGNKFAARFGFGVSKVIAHTGTSDVHLHELKINVAPSERMLRILLLVPGAKVRKCNHNST